MVLRQCILWIGFGPWVYHLETMLLLSTYPPLLPNLLAPCCFHLCYACLRPWQGTRSIIYGSPTERLVSVREDLGGLWPLFSINVSGADEGELVGGCSFHAFPGICKQREHFSVVLCGSHTLSCVKSCVRKFSLFANIRVPLAAASFGCRFNEGICGQISRAFLLSGGLQWQLKLPALDPTCLCVGSWRVVFRGLLFGNFARHSR